MASSVTPEYQEALTDIAALDRTVNYTASLHELYTKTTPKERVYKISFNDLLRHSVDFYNNFVNKPFLYVPALIERLNLDPSQPRIDVEIVGNPVGSRSLIPRDLHSANLKQLFRVRGIVTKVTSPKPILEKLVTYDAGRHAFSEQSYDDPYCTIAPQNLRSFIPRQSAVVYTAEHVAPPPVADGGDGPNPGAGPTLPAQTRREYGLSTFLSTQKVVLQDLPSAIPPGRLPRSVPVFLTNHLVDACKSGDTVEVTGIYNPSLHFASRDASNAKASTVGNFILGLSVEVVDSVPRMVMTSAEEKVTHFLAKASELSEVYNNEKTQSAPRRSASAYALDSLTASLAPSICGHNIVKRAVVLQLLQGVQRTFGASTRIRGDINILLCGDPGSAKSQMLRVASKLLPTAVQTTGRGSSGVGLTAAIVIDAVTGERRLEPGAAVLADRGILLIDEFDKINADDRALLHEALEQQQVSVSKAGIHATLNARCSVLAAANPVYGFFDRSKSFVENLALPDSLLSRYDLIFTILDDHAHDDEIATHVLNNHTQGMTIADLRQQQAKKRLLQENYAAQGAQGGQGGQDAAAAAAAEKLPGFAGLDPLCFAHYIPEIYGPYLRMMRDAWTIEGFYLPSENNLILSHDFLRDIFMYGRAFRDGQPFLSAEAASEMASCFTNLRQLSLTKPCTVPITVRILESMIRLATALAKLSYPPREVSREDAVEAYVLMRHCVFNEGEDAIRRSVLSGAGGRRRAAAGDDGAVQKKFGAKQGGRPRASKEDLVAQTGIRVVDAHDTQEAAAEAAPGAIDESLYGFFENAVTLFVTEVMNIRQQNQVPLSEFASWFEAHCSLMTQPAWTVKAITVYLEHLTTNIPDIFLEDGVIYLS